MMNKMMFLMLMVSMLTGCGAHDANYYRLHPLVLQKQLMACPQKKPDGLSCEDLKQLAESFNQLAYELRHDPQGFGKKIVELQQTLAEKSQSTPNDLSQRDKVAMMQEQLAEYLAVVRWLESPAA